MSDTLSSGAEQTEAEGNAAQTSAPAPQQQKETVTEEKTVFEDIVSEKEPKSEDDFLSELYNSDAENKTLTNENGHVKEPEPDPDDQIPSEYNFDGMEGDVEYTDADKGLVSDLGKELKLTNRQAKELLRKGGAVLNKYRTEAVTKQVNAWSNQIRNDEELGRGHFEETKKNCSLALKHYGSKSLEKLLHESKLGNHPDVVRFFNAIGRDLREESSFAQSQVPAKKKDPMSFLDELYPSMK